MAPPTNSDNPAALLSTTPSIANSDLDTTTDFNRSDINREAATDTSSSADYTGYEGIDWNRLSGYCNQCLGNKMTGPINISIQLAPSVRNILPREEKHQLTCAPHQE
ncbi:hypothetical protein F5883DRAFT_48467 [Diaporthe sp. PMI_573]|nr:hypothetical protein F5883DRAFT_48467 [Diaporthaceae sp. PMI_573]